MGLEDKSHGVFAASGQQAQNSSQRSRHLRIYKTIPRHLRKQEPE